MNTNNPWGNKPAGSQKSGFGNQPNWGGQSGFSQPNVPKPPVYSPAGGYRQPNVPKPPVYGPASGFVKPNVPKPPVYGPTAGLGTAGPFGLPKPGQPASQPWNQKPPQSQAFGMAKPPAKRNFWGDLDGDGKADDWDDLLGDGLLMDAIAAQARAQRGAPPEPEDEFLIGRRSPGQTSARSGGSAGAGFILALGALFVFGLAGLACYLSVIGPAH